MDIDIIVGARPNFVKVAAIIHAIKEMQVKINYRLIHTGQHYDPSLSANFFIDLELPIPEINMNVGSGSAAEQTGAIMVGYEKILSEKRTDCCLVVGDINSSFACAVTAKKMGTKVAHIEAGLRSFDWRMPEEVNRVLIDSIADYFFTTTQDASERLFTTGKKENQVYFVGNTMIDTLFRFRENFRKPVVWNEINLKEKNFLLLTLHRPGNVGDSINLKEVLLTIAAHSRGLPIVFPAHPRTLKMLQAELFLKKNLFIIEPLRYLEFNYLVEKCKAVLTDSGGISEETTALSVPCLTLRDNTERPETVSQGTNELIGTNPEKISDALNKLFEGKWKSGKIPDKWDGKSGKRIVKILENLSF